MELTDGDSSAFHYAVELALEAETEGNLPIGSVITLHGEIIGRGRNAIWRPDYNPNRHAEIEALRNVSPGLWRSSREMTLYTTLEPCLMCLGAILLHRIGRVLYGAADDFGGASQVFGHMPRFFEEELARTEWNGPVFPEECDPLFTRVMRMVSEWQEDGY